MLKYLKLTTVFCLLSFLSIKDVEACHAIALVNINQQNPIAGGIQVRAASDSPTCGCDEYWLDIEVRCLNEAFNPAPFSPGFYGPLNTYPFFQSPQMLKPNCNVVNYPWATIPYATLCPGMTYQYRMRENHNGQAGPWCAAQQFVVPGATQPLVAAANATQTVICAGQCVNLSSSVAQGCQLAATYTWNNGLGTGQNKNNVCPAVTTTYCVTITEACSGFSNQACVTVNVTPPPVNGNASVNPTAVCAGNPVTLNLVGHQGVVQWQSAPNTGGPWTNIVGGTTVPYVTGNINANMCFRAQITGCGAGVLYSNIICVTVNPSPTVVVPGNITICAGGNIPATNFVGSMPGSTFSWTNSNTAIGIGANGNGNIPAFVATNATNAPITATITVIATANGCAGPPSTYNITVNPIPNVVVPANQVYCHGDPIPANNFNSNVVGATFNWTNSNTAIGLPANGAGNIGAFTASNATNNPITATITVTPSANGCPGTPQSFTITINPIPNVVVPVNQVYCEGDAVPANNFNSNVAGATFTWTNSNAAIGIPANGVGNIAAFVAANGTNAPITSTITVTPSVNGCMGAPQNFTITVNPIPDVVVPANQVYCDGDPIPANNFNGSMVGTTFNWTNSNTAIGLPANGVGNIAAFTAANVTSTPIVATITVTPTGNGCTGIPQSFTITINPVPTVIVPANITVCNGATIALTNFIGSIPGVNFTWTNSNTGIGLGANGVGNIPAFVATNATNNPITATITVTPSAGCVGPASSYTITVFPQPTAAFGYTNECFGTATGFTDLSNPNGGIINAWDWDFDNNGTVDNVLQNPTNGYPAAGTYTVELLVTTTNGCKDSITMQVVVNPIPVANFSVAPVCFGAPSVFYDSSLVATGNITAWQWDFGDALGNSNLQNPTYTYGAPGTYAVTLTVTSDSGCIHTYIDSAVVSPEPTASFATNNVCLNMAASFNDTSNPNGGTITSWEWDFNGDNITDDINQNTTNLFPAAGIYNVQLIVSSAAGCSDTIVQPITIHPMPTAAFAFNNECFGTAIGFTDNSAVTTGNITNWDWNFGNMNTSILQNPSENYVAEGVYTVQLIVTTDNGCKDTISQQVEVYPLPVANFNPIDVCLNFPTQFNDLTVVSNAYTINNITNWQWDFGDGVGTSSLQSPTYTYNMEGVYPAYLIVTTNHGCTDSIMLNVTVNPLPQVSFDAPTDGCAPVCMTFVNNSNITSGIISTWAWNFGDGNTAAGMNPSHCFENNSHASVKTFDITLTATSDKGCVTTLMQPSMITAYPMPLADFSFGPQPTDIYDKEITFTDQSIIGSVWNWDLGDGASSTVQHPVHEYADSGTFVVTLFIENQYGCKDTAQKTVIIKPTYAIWIPNSFTPDGDGTNDFFFVKGYGIVELQTLVFDRWGVLIYEGYLLDSKWNGTYKGKISVEDTYVYKVRARNIFNEWNEYIGKVTLLK